jgi:hypothetical protein
MSRSYTLSHGGGQGRSTRLRTVIVRPGKPNAAASSFLSGTICLPASSEEIIRSCLAADQ